MNPIHIDFGDAGAEVPARIERAGSQNVQAIMLSFRICWAHGKQRKMLSNSLKIPRMTHLLWDPWHLDPYKGESDCPVCFHVE